MDTNSAKIRAARALYNKVTQVRAARAAAISTGTLVDIEAAKVQITDEEAERIIAAIKTAAVAAQEPVAPR